MILKEKSWIWYLTFPFAHNDNTTIGNTLYFIKGQPPTHLQVAHEEIHSRQQKEVGPLRFALKYLLCLPLFYNRFRFDCEMEAYMGGEKMSRDEALMYVKSNTYGWLQHE